MTLESKICLLGASAVGKTSLVSRFVHGVFSDVYRTTLGVKIDRKRMTLPGGVLDLVVWDIEGDDEFAQIRPAYVRGANGYLLIADGTRGATLDTALRLHDEVGRILGDAPFVLVINKVDLEPEWEIRQGRISVLRARGWSMVRSSAKTGEGVEASFEQLAQALWERMCPHDGLSHDHR